MTAEKTKGSIQTIADRCRVCYTCVRECPAKAIRIVDGQAEVIDDRCIGCGNCVRVCSQEAKQVVSSISRVEKLLGGDRPVAAIIAPSFSAEFDGLDHAIFVGMVRAIGFKWVNEVAFGADLVARQYRILLEDNPINSYIATTCPAVVQYVEKYHPELVRNLAPIVSPMVAIARVLREMHGENIRVVFIGPCIAKKCEGRDAMLTGEVDAVLTFSELRKMTVQYDIDINKIDPTDFDEPHGGLGAIFPISRGMLQTAGIKEDLLAGEVVAADGKNKFVEALKEFESGDLDARLLEILACNGCIMGAGMTSKEPLFGRRAALSAAVRRKMEELDPKKWQSDIDRFSDIKLNRSFKENDQRIPEPRGSKIREILLKMGKRTPEDELNCGACGYDTCIEHAIAILKGLAENEMCLPYTIETLHRTVGELGVSNEQLASTQEALIHSEKLASMGQLAAGIAHEVNNPLGVVLMYAHLLLEEVGENSEVGEDLRLIAEQADRCKKIVSGLLQFARQNKTVRQPVDMQELIENTAKTIPWPPEKRIEFEFSMDNPVIEIDRDQIAQVLVNLIGNAFAAMDGYGDVIRITAKEAGDNICISVSDTGSGITKENLAKIFDPFFTTKQIGKGTGLGLAVTYGIIKMHQGQINVESNANPAKEPTGTTFIVTLPRVSAQDSGPAIIEDEEDETEVTIS